MVTPGVLETDVNEAVELLRGAARLIETTGLNKGTYFAGIDTGDYTEDLAMAMALDAAPKCCTLGALAYVAGEHIDPPQSVVHDLVIDALVGVGPIKNLGDIPGWNDKDSQRRDRVVATLRKAADHLEKEISK